jgi:tRNA/rRNA methyltransferase
LSREEDFERLRVVLVNTRNPLNIGAAARTMSNFGFLHLRVVNPYELAFREARSAVGAAPLLVRAEEFKSLSEAVADCSLVVGTTALSRRDPQHLVRGLEQGARMIRKRLGSGRAALLFGSEKRGLSNEDLSHCQWLMHIPTREEHRSMNLGQAVAICLYELARDAKLSLPQEKVALATARDLERLTSLLREALEASGYVKNDLAGRPKQHSAAPPEEKIRRLIRRMKLSATDAELLLGMLRQILWKLKTTREGDTPRQHAK